MAGVADLRGGDILLCDRIDNELNDYLYRCMLGDKCIVLGNIQNPSASDIDSVKSLIRQPVSFTPNSIGSDLYKITSSHLNLKEVAVRVTKCIEVLQSLGKNVECVYIKLLCWMHRQSGVFDGSVDTVICYGKCTLHIQMLLYIIAGTGIKVILISSSEVEDTFEVLHYDSVGGIGVTDAFDIKSIHAPQSRLPEPEMKLGINVWLTGDSIREILTPYSDRGELGTIHSALIQVNGVWNKFEYTKTLYEMYSDNSIVVSDFKGADANTINILRMKYRSEDFNSYIVSLCKTLKVSNLDVLANELVKILSDKGNKREQLMLKTIIALQDVIKDKERHCIYFLALSDITELQFCVLYLLACIGWDVVILNPNKYAGKMDIPMLYEMNYDTSYDMKEFPKTSQSLVVETVAYNAENELNSVLYDGSMGMYRDRQFSTADTIYLRPMNEEIDLLWNEEVSVRQGFSVANGIVTLPVIFASVLGLASDTGKWCKRLDSLIEDKNIVLYNSEKPLVDSYSGVIHSASVMRNRKIDFKLLSDHQNYPYSYLNTSIQGHMVRKLQELMDSGVIKGVYTNGVENEVLEVFASLEHIDGLIHLIQNFDFTKVNPKVVYTWMDKQKIPKYDIILLHYLSILGFDVLVLIPTGYNVMDAYIDKKLFTEYQESINADAFTVNHGKGSSSFINKLFRRR